MDSTDSTLALWLAQQARLLGLETARVEEADPEVLQSFVQVVLEELVAQGLLAGEPEIGCWSRPRSSAN